MQLFGGRLYARVLDRSGKAIGTWSIVPDDYLNEAWYFWNGRWKILNLRTEVEGLNRVHMAFYVLAFHLLPF